MNDPKITAIDGGKTPDALLEALRSMKKNLVLLVEYEQYRAKLIRAKYDALVNEGFTEAQALELCKT